MVFPRSSSVAVTAAAVWLITGLSNIVSVYSDLDCNYLVADGLPYALDKCNYDLDDGESYIFSCSDSKLMQTRYSGVGCSGTPLSSVDASMTYDFTCDEESNCDSFVWLTSKYTSNLCSPKTFQGYSVINFVSGQCGTLAGRPFKFSCGGDNNIVYDFYNDNECTIANETLITDSDDCDDEDFDQIECRIDNTYDNNIECNYLQNVNGILLALDQCNYDYLWAYSTQFKCENGKMMQKIYDNDNCDGDADTTIDLSLAAEYKCDESSNCQSVIRIEDIYPGCTNVKTGESKTYFVTDECSYESIPSKYTCQDGVFTNQEFTDQACTMEGELLVSDDTCRDGAIVRCEDGPSMSPSVSPTMSPTTMTISPTTSMPTMLTSMPSAAPTIVTDMPTSATTMPTPMPSSSTSGPTGMPTTSMPTMLTSAPSAGMDTTMPPTASNAVYISVKSVLMIAVFVAAGFIF